MSKKNILLLISYLCILLSFVPLSCSTSLSPSSSCSSLTDSQDEPQTLVTPSETARYVRMFSECEEDYKPVDIDTVARVEADITKTDKYTGLNNELDDLFQRAKRDYVLKIRHNKLAQNSQLLLPCYSEENIAQAAWYVLKLREQRQQMACKLQCLAKLQSHVKRVGLEKGSHHFSSNEPLQGMQNLSPDSLKKLKNLETHIQKIYTNFYSQQGSCPKTANHLACRVYFALYHLPQKDQIEVNKLKLEKLDILIGNVANFLERK